MAPLYELAILGSPSDAQRSELKQFIAEAVERFGLLLGQQVSWLVEPEEFAPNQRRSAAAVFFCGRNASTSALPRLLKNSIPVLPVASDESEIGAIPDLLRPFNCLFFSTGGIQRVGTALLECVGLLPRQRRVFVSYRRSEARQAALQLFDGLSARLFDVFLDTHGIPPAEDFQAMLWHRLCDSDVLVMLDTATYFESRWTSAEFGRALAKGISVLRVGWPDCTPSARTATASRVELLAEEIDERTGRLTDSAIARVCLQLETVRSESHAVRHINLVSNVRYAIEKIGGSVSGVGMHKAVFIKLPDDRDLAVYPTIGVPTSTSLHDAVINASNSSVAVVYDPVGLHPQWLEHLEWLGKHIREARWVKTTEAAWQFADWVG